MRTSNYYVLLTKYVSEGKKPEFECFKSEVMETLYTSEWQKDYKELFKITGISDGMELVDCDPYTKNGTCVIAFLAWVVDQGEAFFNELYDKGVIMAYLERLQDVDNGNRLCKVKEEE